MANSDLDIGQWPIRPEAFEKDITASYLIAEPGHCLPELGDKLAFHSKANSKGEKTSRPNLRQVRRSRFVPAEC